MASRRKESEFRENARYRILRLLEKNSEMNYREIASELGISVGGVHYCLRALVDRGMVKIQNFRASDHKLHYAYVVTPRGLAEKAMLAGRFLQSRLAEYEMLKAEIELIRAEMGMMDEGDSPGPFPLPGTRR